MSLDRAERKLKALQRLVRAQETGLIRSPVILTTDPAGATPEGAERILEREMAERGLEPDDLKEAGLDVIHVNLPWASGRNLRFGDKAAGLADENGQDILVPEGTHYDPAIVAEKWSPDYQSAGHYDQTPSPERLTEDNSEEGGNQSPLLPPNE